MRAAALLASLALLATAGCGFALRGATHLPFQTIYVPGPNSGVALDLRRSLQSETNARVVADPRDAQALLQFTEERRDKEILSLTGAGRVAEFQLRYQVGFRVHDGKGHDYVPPSTILLTREITYSDVAVLAKDAEEQLLYRDMQSDMAQQIMRRLAAVQGLRLTREPPPAPAAATPIPTPPSPPAPSSAPAGTAAPTTSNPPAAEPAPAPPAPGPTD